LRGEKKYSILADHLGTPYESYDDKGDLVWSRELNANGKVLKETGIANFCPFLYQGQSFDNEIELAYNRFRYYDVEDGRYISQDPIGLTSGELGFYSYVEDTNEWVDIFGLKADYGNQRNRAKRLAKKEAKRLRGIKSDIRVVTVVVHKKTGKAFVGHSGHKSKINSKLKNKLPKNSTEQWTVDNCAEVDAFNQGMNKINGSMPDDFVSSTVQVNTGSIKPPCTNCAQWVP
jgi:RHS repeat-associated protein